MGTRLILTKILLQQLKDLERQKIKSMGNQTTKVSSMISDKLCLLIKCTQHQMEIILKNDAERKIYAKKYTEKDIGGLEVHAKAEFLGFVSNFEELQQHKDDAQGNKYSSYELGTEVTHKGQKRYKIDQGGIVTLYTYDSNPLACGGNKVYHISQLKLNVVRILNSQEAYKLEITLKENQLLKKQVQLLKTQIMQLKGAQSSMEDAKNEIINQLKKEISDLNDLFTKQKAQQKIMYEKIHQKSRQVLDLELHQQKLEEQKLELKKKLGQLIKEPKQRDELIRQIQKLVFKTTMQQVKDQFVEIEELKSRVIEREKCDSQRAKDNNLIQIVQLDKKSLLDSLSDEEVEDANQNRDHANFQEDWDEVELKDLKSAGEFRLSRVGLIEKCTEQVKKTPSEKIHKAHNTPVTPPKKQEDQAPCLKIIAGSPLCFRVEGKKIRKGENWAGLGLGFPIAHQRVTFFSIKIAHTARSLIKIGIFQTNIEPNPEDQRQILCFFGRSGKDSLGASTGGKWKGLKQGDVVMVEVDRCKQKIEWRVNDEVLGGLVFKSLGAEADFVPFVQMFDKGDAIEWLRSYVK